MSSIEAMAMASMDCKECAISLEEWDPRFPQQPPLYLQLDNNDFVDANAERMKAKLREWAKAVAFCSKQEDMVFHVKM
ncbi:hypothetical protein SESBI_00961 [Sesbania bispinosa]|nr:hypothetical protein SESBI_00961 [Sesbania bispinosa]